MVCKRNCRYLALIILQWFFAWCLTCCRSWWCSCSSCGCFWCCTTVVVGGVALLVAFDGVALSLHLMVLHYCCSLFNFGYKHFAWYTNNFYIFSNSQFIFFLLYLTRVIICLAGSPCGKLNHKIILLFI